MFVVLSESMAMSGLAKMTVLVVTGMSYARLASSVVSPGSRRLLSLLPVLCLLPFLPFCCASITLRAVSVFFLSWLAFFKLILLAFGLGPLRPSLPLGIFIATASLPVELRDGAAAAAAAALTKKTKPSGVLFARIAFKASLLCFIVPFQRYKNQMPTYAILAIYSSYVYLGLDVVLSGVAGGVRALLGVDLEPQADAPYLSTSLQDFWGRRWNLMVTSVLRPSVYLPVRGRWGSTAGVLAVFLVSGLMHEVMFSYYLTGSRPTGEVTGFFLLHGVCLAAEVRVKRAVGPRVRVPPAAATAATLGFVAATGYLLFLPFILRTGADDRVVGEFLAMLGYLEDAGRFVAGWVPLCTGFRRISS